MSARKSKLEIVMLFEDEIRTAARAILRFAEMRQNGSDEAAVAAALADAIKASSCALQGAESENHVLIMVRKTDFLLSMQAYAERQAKIAVQP